VDRERQLSGNPNLDPNGGDGRSVLKNPLSALGLSLSL
jgi:hypothetical protein